MNTSDGARRVHRADDRGPVVRVRRVAGARAPRPREDLVRHQHRHVAANAVALRRRSRSACRSRPSRSPARERVQLDDVRPRREVGVLAVREHAGRRLEEARRVRGELGGGAPDEVVGVLGRPRVIGRDVVRDVVEDQAQTRGRRARPAPRRARSRRRNAARARSRGRSTASRSRRPAGGPAGSRGSSRRAPAFCCAIASPAGLRCQTPISQTASTRSAASRSHSSRRHRREHDRTAELPAQVAEPDGRVDLVDRGARGKAHG